jgi:hypothetical protein
MLRDNGKLDVLPIPDDKLPGICRAHLAWCRRLVPRFRSTPAIFGS